MNLNLHSHPSMWGTKYIFHTDLYLPEDFPRRRMGYWAERCGCPGCKVVMLRDGFYDDARDEDLVGVAQKLAEAGYVLFVPSERMDRIGAPETAGENEVDYREPAPETRTRLDVKSKLKLVEAIARNTKRPRSHGEPWLSPGAKTLVQILVASVSASIFVNALVALWKHVP